MCGYRIPTIVFKELLQLIAQPASATIRRNCLLLAALTVLLLFYLGAQPFAVNLIPEPWDKLAHFTAFAFISVLIWIGSGGLRPWILVTLISVVGGLDEWHQRSLPGRSADLTDLLVDISAASAIALGCMFLSRRQTPENGGPTALPRKHRAW